VAIQDHLEEVESLQKEYEKLEWVIDRAFSFDKYGKVAEQTKNLGKQIENTSKAIALEEDKKDTDEERIKELRENAEKARRQIHELYDNLRQEIVGSYEDLSSTLADAMIEAFKSGEDALKAWGDEVDNIIANIVTKLAVQKYVEPQVSRVLDQFYNKVMPKNAAAEKAFTRLQSMTVGTKEYEEALAEWEKLNSQAIGELPQLTESSVGALKDSLNAIGVSFEPIAEQVASIFGGQGGGLSALQKGISGMSEQQAEILTAYWNSVRGYTASIDSKMDLILANMSIGAENNPMLEQLISQTSWLSKIHGILDGLTTTSENVVGRRIKVTM
jgi:chromosome segregation ATPase